MRMAADPVHGAALSGELHRPDECRFGGPHHEQGLGFFAHGVRVRSGHLFHRLRTVPSARQCDSRTDRGAALGVRHYGRMGFAIRLERTGTNPDQFLPGAFSPGRRGSWVCPRRVPELGFAYFAWNGAGFGITLWLPQIVKALGFSNSATGFVVALCYVACVPAMILGGRSSSRRSERIWHVALPFLLTASCLAV